MKNSHKMVETNHRVGIRHSGPVERAEKETTKEEQMETPERERREQPTKKPYRKGY